jgi:hypothetical protein
MPKHRWSKDTQMRIEAFHALCDAGAPPEIAFAFITTGLLRLHGDDMSGWPIDRREKWEAAVAQYRRMKHEAQQAKKEKPTA